MKECVLITGGAGFLGSHLCDRFIEKEYRVFCMDNLITGAVNNINHLMDNKNFEFIEHDVSKEIKIKDDIDCVIHFASLASPVDYLQLPIPTLKVGSLGVHNTLGLAKFKKAKYLIASTSEVYGDPQVHPQKESYWGNVNPIGPRGCYDESKRFQEAMTVAYNRTHGIDTRIVRIFNTYGPRMRINDGRVVPNFIYQALCGDPLTVYGDGGQTRSFCFYTDLIDGIIRLLDVNYTDPVNLGNPDEFTISDFSKLVLELIHTKSEIVYKDLPVDDPIQRCPDISLAKKILGWEPKVSIQEGLQKTIDWFKKEIS